MKIFLNILKFTIGIPIMVILSICWAIASLLFTILFLPVFDLQLFKDCFNDFIDFLKTLWSSIK